LQLALCLRIRNITSSGLLVALSRLIIKAKADHTVALPPNDSGAVMMQLALYLRIKSVASSSLPADLRIKAKAAHSAALLRHMEDSNKLKRMKL
jgi:hypothetical protein